MLISLAYRLTRRLLGALATVARRDISKDAELLVLRHENTVLRRHISRVRYEPEDRLWLSALSSLIPRRRWAEVFPISPTTLLTWHRRLVANKYTTTPHGPGRPPTRAAVKALVIRMATENPTWGYRRNPGASQPTPSRNHTARTHRPRRLPPPPQNHPRRPDQRIPHRSLNGPTRPS